MKLFMRGVAAFHLLFFLLSSAHAENPDVCQALYRNYQTDWKNALNGLENDYASFRLAEFKGRRLMYENIWAARIEANDPLDVEKRKRGSEEEKRLQESLAEIRKDSGFAAGRFKNTLDHLLQSDSQAPGMCKRPDFRVCLLDANKPVYDILKQLRTDFEKIFEHERAYRTAVEAASGGRDGLYPDDTLESTNEHSDYYWRFENSRSPDRFEQDRRIAALLNETRTILTKKFAGDLCCHGCR